MNEEKKFTPGDIVTLKTGGPLMTVERYNAHDEVCCVWFEKRPVGANGVALIQSDAYQDYTWFGPCTSSFAQEALERGPNA